MKPRFDQNIQLGVLGGGQLGRMLIQSAINFNLDVHILDPDADAPCATIATWFTQGALTDYDTVYQWGQKLDLITIEIENVNVAALKALQKEGKKVYPQPEIIELIQDKRIQKEFYRKNGIPTSPFVLVENKEEVKKHIDFLPAVNKLGREGYDGRGVQKIKSTADVERAFDKPGLLEKFVDFEKEISVIVARNERGETKTFPVVELVFNPVYNLVEYLFAPAEITAEQAGKAEAIAIQVIEKLGMVGLLAVEMFLTKEGEILVNEVAPRTHNSGHQTIEANITSQFEQHLRSILNLPLGATDAKIPSAMVNLLGEADYSGKAKYTGMDTVLAISGVSIHLYGKKFTKPFRKMGHITIVDTDMERLKEKAITVKESLKVIA